MLGLEAKDSDLCPGSARPAALDIASIFFLGNQADLGKIKWGRESKEESFFSVDIDVCIRYSHEETL